jgi:hypothetical protein
MTMTAAREIGGCGQKHQGRLDQDACAHLDDLSRGEFDQQDAGSAGHEGPAQHE